MIETEPLAMRRGRRQGEHVALFVDRDRFPGRPGQVDEFFLSHMTLPPAKSRESANVSSFPLICAVVSSEFG